MSLKQPQSILLLDNYGRHLSDSEKELETGQRLSDGFGTCDLTCTRSCLMSLSKFPYRWPLKATQKVVTLEVDSTLTQKQIQKRKLKQFSFLNTENQGL